MMRNCFFSEELACSHDAESVRISLALVLISHSGTKIYLSHVCHIHSSARLQVMPTILWQDKKTSQSKQKKQHSLLINKCFYTCHLGYYICYVSSKRAVPSFLFLNFSCQLAACLNSGLVPISTQAFVSSVGKDPPQKQL